MRVSLTNERKGHAMRYALLLHYPEMTADDLGTEGGWPPC